MSEATIRDLFEKLRNAQHELDLAFADPRPGLPKLEAGIRKEHKVLHAIVMELEMPKVIQRLKTASAAAQAANAQHREGKLSLEERNAAVKAAVEARDEMIHLINDKVQDHLFEYNCTMKKQRPDLVTEFGIAEASSLCAAS